MKLSEQLIIRTFDDSTMIMNLDNGKVTVLDDIGTIFWNAITENNVDNIIKYIIEEYDVDEFKVKKDYDEFFQKLVDLNILV